MAEALTAGWQCSACTYGHFGGESIFLTCKLCGAERPLSQAAQEGSDTLIMSPTEVVVVGVTGCTRSGKGRVSSTLYDALGGAPSATIVGQDQFWREEVQAGEPIYSLVVSD